MTDITTPELYQLYLDTISRCSALREKAIEDAEYDLYEELDVGIHSFLHEDTLQRLSSSGLIDDAVMRLSLEVRSVVNSLRDGKWSFDHVQNDKDWESLIALSKRILVMISKTDDLP